MLNELPEDEFGPPIRIREYSLFANPSMPKKVFLQAAKQQLMIVHLL